MSDIRECFREYPVEDQVEAVKRILGYNERSIRDGPGEIVKRGPKESIGVKECLETERKTPFQTLVSELKDTVMRSYWDKEVGKTRYQVPNLPVGLDPLETTFGKETKPQETVARLLTVQETRDDSIPGKSPKPWGQIDRNYKEPFNKHFRFGKRNKAHVSETRVKGLLTWAYQDSVAETREEDAKFDQVHGKAIKQEEDGVWKALNDCLIGEVAVLQKKYLRNLNGLRQRLKKRYPEVPFLDIYEEFFRSGQSYEDFLPEESVFAVLKKYGIWIDEGFLPLLDILGIRKDGNVAHKKLVDLLNWRSEFPTLPKVNTFDTRLATRTDCQDFASTYNQEICNRDLSIPKDIPAAGVPSSRWDLPVRPGNEDLGDQTSVHSIVSPSIFTRHGLSHLDFFKPRDKEEIRGIFENIGPRFSDEDFEALWAKGLRMDNSTNTVCVETFRKLIP